MTTYQNGFSALADPTRRPIFERLARRPRPVGELAEGLPVSRPAVSQHLKVLADAGLVSRRGTATAASTGWTRTGWPACAQYLDRFWSDALAAFERAARAEEKK